MHKKKWLTLSATVLCLGTIAADGMQAQKADVGAVRIALFHREHDRLVGQISRSRG